MANLQSIFPKAVNVVGENRDPIQSLWRNVLIVALEDALGKGFKSYGMSYKNYDDSARRWFTDPNADFKAVCMFAGFDHEYIRMKATNILERNKMAELRDEHFEVISSNRARVYEKQKKTTNIIKTLLKRYTKKQLIEMIEKESKNV